MSRAIVTRFAPSPTGMLHIGGVRTALFSWLLAQRNHGQFILRIEDTDLDRSTEENIRIIEEGLAWVGLNWDQGPVPGDPNQWRGSHGPYRQILRMDLYQSKIKYLLMKGFAYRCRCTKEQLEVRRKKAEQSGRPFQYNRGADEGQGCRDHHHDASMPHAIRFVMPDDGDIVLNDLIKGEIRFPGESLDDWVIARWSDENVGVPTYNFCVVVDDVEMEISHVLRGDDHVSNTPKQIELFKALGAPLPQFAHVPMILGKDKQKLSKRHGAASITEFRDLGFLPRAVRLTLAKLSWTPKIDGQVATSAEEEILTDAQLISAFNMEDIQKSPSVFDIDKLYWVNQKIMMITPVDELISLIKPFVPSAFHEKDYAWKHLAISSLQERSRTLKEMGDSLSFCWSRPLEFDEKAVTKYLTSPVRSALSSVGEIDPWTAESVKTGIEKIIDAHGIKLKDIAQGLRVCLTGGTISPPIHETLLMLGKDEVNHRLQPWILS